VDCAEDVVTPIGLWECMLSHTVWKCIIISSLGGRRQQEGSKKEGRKARKGGEASLPSLRGALERGGKIEAALGVLLTIDQWFCTMVFCEVVSCRRSSMSVRHTCGCIIIIQLMNPDMIGKVGTRQAVPYSLTLRIRTPTVYFGFIMWIDVDSQQRILQTACVSKATGVSACMLKM